MNFIALYVIIMLGLVIASLLFIHKFNAEILINIFALFFIWPLSLILIAIESIGMNKKQWLEFMRIILEGK